MQDGTWPAFVDANSEEFVSITAPGFPAAEAVESRLARRRGFIRYLSLALRPETAGTDPRSVLSGVARAQQRRLGPFLLRDDSERTFSRVGLSTFPTGDHRGACPSLPSVASLAGFGRWLCGGAHARLRSDAALLSKAVSFFRALTLGRVLRSSRENLCPHAFGPSRLPPWKVSLRSPPGRMSCSSSHRLGRKGSSGWAFRLLLVPGKKR